MSRSSRMSKQGLFDSAPDLHAAIFSLIVVIRPSVSMRPTSSYDTSETSAATSWLWGQLTGQEITALLCQLPYQLRHARLAGAFRPGEKQWTRAIRDCHSAKVRQGALHEVVNPRQSRCSSSVRSLVSSTVTFARPPSQLTDAGRSSLISSCRAWCPRPVSTFP